MIYNSKRILKNIYTLQDSKKGTVEVYAWKAQEEMVEMVAGNI